MRRKLSKLGVSALALAGPGLLAVVACSADGGGYDSASAAGSAGSGGGSSSEPDGGDHEGITFDGDVPDTERPPPVGDVYAHSARYLYKLDPISKEVTTIGRFNCNTGDMYDIAIDKNGLMIGTAAGALVEIDAATAKCKILVSKDSLSINSLTFVPAGTLDPNEEALVGYQGSDYIRIDKTTGSTQKVGSLNLPSASPRWVSSGDIVSIIGGGTYLTVYPSGNSQVDSIVEVNPATGQLVKVIGSTGFSKLYGLGYWDGVAYGFSGNGTLCEIDLTTGLGSPILVPNAESNLSFYGAGVTTAAPPGIL